MNNLLSFDVFNLNEGTLVVPKIPNTMNFWHGGDLDDYTDFIKHEEDSQGDQG